MATALAHSWTLRCDACGGSSEVFPDEVGPLRDSLVEEFGFELHAHRSRGARALRRLPRSRSHALHGKALMIVCAQPAAPREDQRRRERAGDAPHRSRLELSAIAVLNRGIELARQVGDNGSADLLEDILEGEEEHANWLEGQLTAIAQMGPPSYLAEQLKGS